MAHILVKLKAVLLLKNAMVHPKSAKDTAIDMSLTMIMGIGFEKAGLTLAGSSPDGRLIETVELTDRDFYVGVQYHPEFKSRPNKPHPLFKGFISAAIGHLKGTHI